MLWREALLLTAGWFLGYIMMDNAEFYLTLISRSRAREVSREQDPGNGSKARIWFPGDQLKGWGVGGAVLIKCDKFL